MAHNQKWNMTVANDEKYDSEATKRLKAIVEGAPTEESPPGYDYPRYEYPIDAIKREIRRGADPHVLARPAVNNGMDPLTPLVMLAKHGEADFIQELFALGLEPSVYMLFKAAVGRINPVKTIDVILQANPDLINAKDDSAYNNDLTPLMYAIQRRVPLNVIEHLLQRGADPNLQTGHGHTSLMLATMYSNNTQLIQLLLQHGAEPELQDLRGKTAFNFAKTNNQKNLLKTEGGRRKRRTAHHRKRRTARKHKTHRRRR